MKIAVVNFTISNGGDFLIERRMNALIHKTFPKAKLEFINGAKNAIDVDYASFDAVIGGGGPYYDDRIAEDLFIPFFDGFIQNQVPVHILGSGVYGDEFSDEYIYTKFFQKKTMCFYKSIENLGGTFGCRDEISWRILRSNGLGSVFLTGCPAMYDFEYINRDTKIIPSDIRKIVISDPGVTKNPNEQRIRAQQAIDVIETILDMFPFAETIFTFNNGIYTKYSHICNKTIERELERRGIKSFDLSNGAKGFSIYNDADLHIGFRVHSHIYSLSRHIPSVLIEEDLRGYGINETLGLPHIPSFSVDYRCKTGCYQPNHFICRKLKDILDYNISTNFKRYKGVYDIIKALYYHGYMEWKSVVNKRLNIRF